MIDDGERAELTDKAYGAALVTVVRALQKEDRLDVEHFPSLETFLRAGAAWGVGMAGATGSTYYKVLNGIGRRLFKNKSPEADELQKARVEEWIKTLPADEQAEIKKTREEGDEDEDEDEDDGVAWYDEKGPDENHKSKDYTFSRVWKEYRTYLRECPEVPLRGPPEWDLTEWSDADKAPFSFDNMED